MARISWSQATVLVIGLWASAAAGQTPPPAVVQTPPPAVVAADAGDGPALPLADAVRTALRIHPNIQEARALVDARSADVLGAGAVLDPVLLARLGYQRNRTPVLLGERLAAETGLADDSSELFLGGLKTLPWGTQIAPTVRLIGVHQRRTPDDPALAGLAQRSARARADLAAIQPLLRGRGEVGTLSGLRAAERDREAAEHVGAYIAQQTVFGVDRRVLGPGRHDRAGRDSRRVREARPQAARGDDHPGQGQPAARRGPGSDRGAPLDDRPLR